MSRQRAKTPETLFGVINEGEVRGGSSSALTGRQIRVKTRCQALPGI